MDHGRRDAAPLLLFSVEVQVFHFDHFYFVALPTPSGGDEIARPMAG
jgi:hypothetical protein